jgi:hypothetical protein
MIRRVGLEQAATRAARRRLGVRAALRFMLAMTLWTHSASGDAIMRTQAMTATTIAEYFVERDQIRLELEIGLDDLDGFRNLVPDPIYERLGHPERPLAERLDEFFGHDLVILAGDGAPLFGRIVSMGPRPRIRRDEITGESLPPLADAEPEMVIEATLVYALPEVPKTITLYGPALGPAPNIGFVAYHGSIAVNDFRYLTGAQTLTLDWDDPWYSSFDSRSLRRTYFAPMSGFLYIEPFEVRKEIIVRPIDLQGWVDLGLEGRQTIPPDLQPELMRRVAEFLQDRQRVTIDDEAVVPELSRINFLERTLRTSRVIDPPEELNVHSATLGVIFSYPTTGLPENVKMDWDLFNERIQIVPGASVDQAGSLPTFLEPDYAVLEWQNFLKNPELPTLVDVRRPPNGAERFLGWSRWALLPLGLFAAASFAVRARRGSMRPIPAVLAGAVVASAGVLAFVAGGAAATSDERAGEVVEGVLHNIYRAFDYRQEEQVYDILGRSVEGDLLEEIYLETRRGLELANQGGARARVKAIELTDIAASSGEKGAVVARTTWNVFGSVGHWGHIHSRSNRYEAELEISPSEGVWKLSRMEILDEQRL